MIIEVTQDLATSRQPFCVVWLVCQNVLKIIKVQIKLFSVFLPMFCYRYVQICKIAGCACAGNAGNVFPAIDLKGNR